MKNISNNIFTHSISAFFLVFADWPRSVKQWKFHYGMVTYHRLLSALCPSPSPSWPIQLFDHSAPLFCFLFLLLFVYSNTAKKLLPRPAFIGSVTNSLSFKLNPHVYHTLVLIRMNLSIASQAHYNMRQSKSGQPGNLAITTIASSSSAPFLASWVSSLNHNDSLYHFH